MSPFKSYDELKDEIINKFQSSAKTRIPILVKALKLENPQIPKEEIKDRILTDFIQYWTRETIMNALGDEYKDKVKQEAGKESARSIRAKESQIPPIVVTNKGSTQEESNSSNVLGIQPEKKLDPIVPTPKEWKSDKPEDAEFLKNKLNKVLEDLKAEQLKGEQKANTIVQLQEAISKSAFKSASETGDNKYELVVDSVNIDHFPSVDLSKFLSIASSLKKRGWKRVEMWVKALP